MLRERSVEAAGDPEHARGEARRNNQDPAPLAQDIEGEPSDIAVGHDLGSADVPASARIADAFRAGSSQVTP